MKQASFNLYKGWGGRRPGSGRKRIHSPGVAHRKRERIRRNTLLHINMRYETRVRNEEFLFILKRAILNSRKKGLRFIQYSVQSNHIHFVIETDSNQSLSAGMRSLTVTLTMGLQKGRVQLERYHLNVLRCPTEAWNAVNYVAFNDARHSGRRKIDSYSSASTLLNLKFDYCITKMDRPRSWLLSSQSP